MPNTMTRQVSLDSDFHAQQTVAIMRQNFKIVPLQARVSQFGNGTGHRQPAVAQNDLQLRTDIFTEHLRTLVKQRGRGLPTAGERAG